MNRSKGLWILAAVVSAALACTLLYRGTGHARETALRRVTTLPDDQAKTSDASRLRGDRASHDERADATALARTTADLIRRLRIEADGGSARSQRRLAEHYAFCIDYTRSPADELAKLDQLAAESPADKVAILAARRRLIARCDAVDDGSLIDVATYHAMRRTAADMGDAVARIDIRAEEHQPLTAKEVEDLFVIAIASRDPDALLAFANIAARPAPAALRSDLAALVGDVPASAAWVIAACQLGAACGRGALSMDRLCRGLSRCHYRTLSELYLAEGVRPGDRVRVGNMSRQVLRHART